MKLLSAVQLRRWPWKRKCQVRTRERWGRKHGKGLICPGETIHSFLQVRTEYQSLSRSDQNGPEICLIVRGYHALRPSLDPCPYGRLNIAYPNPNPRQSIGRSLRTFMKAERR